MNTVLILAVSAIVLAFLLLQLFFEHREPVDKAKSVRDAVALVLVGLLSFALANVFEFGIKIVRWQPNAFLGIILAAPLNFALNEWLMKRRARFDCDE